jgi:hypothetical protein
MATTKRTKTRKSGGAMETRGGSRRTSRRDEHYHPPQPEPEPLHLSALSALELYRLEKERRARIPREPAPDDPMVAAKREYLALLEAEALRGKGGRPRKNAQKPKDEDLELDD